MNESMKWPARPDLQGNIDRRKQEIAGLAEAHVAMLRQWFAIGEIDGEVNRRTHLGMGTIAAVRAKWVKSLYKLAEASDAEAQYHLGMHHYDCDRTEEDYRVAVKWFRKADRRGHARAAYWLGHCYGNGIGVERDNGEARRCWRRSADRGYAGALILLGEHYAHGHGVRQDEREAVRWYRKAADQGVAAAQSFLGFCYVTGTGVEKDRR